MRWAHSLDDARQTAEIRYLYDSELLEDVLTMNDFGFPLRKPNHPLYLNSEFNGHLFSTKRFDNITRVAEHVTRHARVHDQLASDKAYAGGVGWCAKPVVVLQAGFCWSSGDHSEAGGMGPVPILSNCEHLKIYYAGTLKDSRGAVSYR
jgi:hypothetical protein